MSKRAIETSGSSDIKPKHAKIVVNKPSIKITITGTGYKSADIINRTYDRNLKPLVNVKERIELIRNQFLQNLLFKNDPAFLIVEMLIARNTNKREYQVEIADLSFNVIEMDGVVYFGVDSSGGKLEENLYYFFVDLLDDINNNRIVEYIFNNPRSKSFYKKIIKIINFIFDDEDLQINLSGEQD
jgi:hypothetical protein